MLHLVFCPLCAMPGARKAYETYNFARCSQGDHRRRHHPPAQEILLFTGGFIRQGARVRNKDHVAMHHTPADPGEPAYLDALLSDRGADRAPGEGMRQVRFSFRQVIERDSVHLEEVGYSNE